MQVTSYSLKIADGNAVIYTPDTAKYTYEIEIQKDQYDTLLQMCQKVSSEVVSPLRALATPVRTNSLSSIAEDVTFPLTLNGTAFSEKNGCEISASVFTVAIELLTIPVRLVTLLPTFAYNCLQDEHPLKRHLVNNLHIDSKYFASGHAVICLHERIEKANDFIALGRDLVSVNEQWKAHKINFVETLTPEYIKATSLSGYRKAQIMALTGACSPQANEAGSTLRQRKINHLGSI